MSSNKGFSNYAILFRLMLLALAGLATCIVTWLFFAGLRFTGEISVTAIRPESGFAYGIDMSAFKEGPLLGRGDSSSAPTVSTTVLREDANRLGPAHSPHQEIRDLGGGRFSHWGEGLVFSTSDNSDPRGNNRKYVVELSLYLPFYYVLLAATFLSGAVIANHREIALAARVGRSVVAYNRVLLWTRQNVMPPLIGTKSDPVSWDTELARMTVTKEAGHGDEAEEAGDTAGAVQSTERARAPRTMECPAKV